MKRVTIDDVARHAGVSIGTVSAVLNQKQTVNQKTRDLVLNSIQELNYRPSGIARNVRTDATDFKSIGLLIREMDNPFYTEIASGVMEYCIEKNYIVYLASSESDHTYSEKITQSFSNQNIKGAIIAPVLEGTAEIEHLFALKKINFPFVLLENVPGIQANVVSIDNIQAMKDTVKYLIDTGHTRIIHFAGPKHAYHAYERIDGFRFAYSESPFIFSNNMIIPAGAYLEEGYQTCIDYFKNRNRKDYPTAIVCYNDLVAHGAITALTELNIKVPEEISVVGNDDILFSKYAPLKLTTIHAPMHELGRKAAEILIKNIESPTTLPMEKIVMHGELVVRETTCVREPIKKQHDPSSRTVLSNQ